MNSINLTSEVNKIIEEFDSLDHSNTKKVLEWFYKTKEFNSMYESPMIREYILGELSLEGQHTKENFNETFKRVLKGETLSKIDEENILTEILSSIQINEGITERLISLLEIYVEKYDLYYANDLMMEKLEKHIGKRVVLMGYYHGDRIFLNGPLDNVIPYESVTVDSVIYPFIGSGVALTQISSSTGEKLYSNKFIEPGYNIEDNSIVEELKRKKFGVKRDTVRIAI